MTGRGAARIGGWSARLVGVVAVLMSAAASSAPDAPEVAGQPFFWHHEHAKFNYLGLTARYSCDALESQVRRILVHLGARADAKVTATGCPLSSTAPGPHAWVDAEFDVPMPAAGAADAVAGATAAWRSVTLAPRQPNFLSAGDCELIEGMRDVFSQSLHLRDLKYRATCMPGSLSIDGFEVSGLAFKSIEAAKGASPGR